MRSSQLTRYLTDATERALRKRTAYACAGSAYHQPLSVRVARKVRRVLWALAVLLLLAAGAFPFDDAEEALVASEVEDAPAMVRQQLKVENALHIASKEAPQ